MFMSARPATDHFNVHYYFFLHLASDTIITVTVKYSNTAQPLCI